MGENISKSFHCFVTAWFREISSDSQRGSERALAWICKLQRSTWFLCEQGSTNRFRARWFDQKSEIKIVESLLGDFISKTIKWRVGKSLINFHYVATLCIQQLAISPRQASCTFALPYVTFSNNFFRYFLWIARRIVFKKRETLLTVFLLLHFFIKFAEIAVKSSRLPFLRPFHFRIAARVSFHLIKKSFRYLSLTGAVQ